MKLDQLRSDLDRCNINPVLVTLPFADRLQISKRLCGLYSIWENNHCVYVGKTGNNIATRLLHHHNKAFGIWENGTRDTLGWKLGRNRAGWNPNIWTIEYFECASSTHRTYLEGAMILLFNPECNDETVEDRISRATNV